MKKTLTFRGGIHPDYNKGVSITRALHETPLPSRVIIPLSQHIGAPAQATVKKGDDVREGDVVGQSESFISAPVHSSIAGKVTDIKKARHPSLGPVLSVFIDRDETAVPVSYEDECRADDLSPAEIIEKVRQAGIVGMGGAAFPSHVKLSVPEGRKVDTLLINAAECEPYLTCDQLLMATKTREILEGIRIIQKVLVPQRTVIAIEDNKKAAIFAFEKILKEQRQTGKSLEVTALQTKYPQGAEKQLIKAVTGREVPPGKLPIDAGCIVFNAGTVFAVREAVVKNKPLIERVVTVSGDCVKDPGNHKIRIGTIIEDLIDLCQIHLEKQPGKIIVGGPMMGISQVGMDVPIVKGTSGILFMSDKAAPVHTESPCIRCARCVDVCPMRLSPTDIMRRSKKEQWQAAEELYAADCMECGSCSFTCPARIPLVQYIKQAKAAFALKA